MTLAGSIVPSNENNMGQGRKGTRGAVAAGHLETVRAAAITLDEGGNAFDAVIAAAFMQMIVDPFMCGPGGMGTGLFFNSSTGESHTIDFHGRAGSRVTPEMWQADMKGRTAISGYTLFDDFRSELGYTSITTPGTIAGFAEVHKRYATKRDSRIYIFIYGHSITLR